MIEELDSSTGYLGNPNLKRTRVPISWTPELLEEFLKCQEDPIYFAEKYIKIVHVDRGLIPIVLYDYQKEIIVAFNENRRTAVVTSRQAGKCVTGETKITVRHKDTGQVVDTTFYELYEEVKQNVIGCSNQTSIGSRKFVESYDITGWEVLTEAGFVNVSQFHKTVEYERYTVLLDNGLQLNCADDHILIENNGEQVFAKDSIGSVVRTTRGDSCVVEVNRTGMFEYMFDLTVDSDSHTYYTNDILSHNTTTAAALILHFILFNEHKTVALLANKGDASREILDRIKLAYEALPKWMQSGIVTWNKGSIELENGCKVIAAATSSSAIRGKSIALLYIDECSQGLTLVTILNKLTGEVQQIKIEDLYKFNSFDNYLIKTDSGFKEFSTVSCVEAATVLLKFDDGSELGCTYGHRIKTADGSYTEARDLKVGDKTSTGLTLLSKEDNGRHKVYDVVEVDGGTYLTGNVVSHNCAFVNNWDEFFASVFPTISSGNTTKILLTSTPNGLNHFYQICEGAKEGTNGYAFVEVSWQRIPGRDDPRTSILLIELFSIKVHSS
jgi:hypothetical protein